jgi:hypothetical protein
MSKKLTTQEFKDKYKDRINKSIEIIGEYLGKNKDILCKCLICNTEYTTTPESLKQGCGHKTCSSIKANDKNRLNVEIIKNRLKDINNDIEIIGGTYNNQQSKLNCRCRICEHIWSPRSNDLLRGKGCPKCSRSNANISKTFTHSKFLNVMKQIDKNIIFLSEYTKARNKIKCKCLICNNEWSSTADSLMRGHGCKKCSIMKTDEEFLNQLYEVNELLLPLEKYKGAESKIKIKCLKCNNEWYALPHGILRGTGCPKCNLSKGERKVVEYLDTNNIYYEPQKEYSELLGVGYGNLSYDFYLPKYNLLIEYQGEFHDGTAYQQKPEEFEIQKEHDKRKKEYAKLHNIKLLEIWYWDFNNIEKILNKELGLLTSSFSIA